MLLLLAHPAPVTHVTGGTGETLGGGSSRINDGRRRVERESLNLAMRVTSRGIASPTDTGDQPKSSGET